MNKYELYIQISEHIKGKKFEDRGLQDVVDAKRLITDILNGKRPTSSLDGYVGCFANSVGTMSDAELLMAVLKSCSEDVLLGLEKEFGRESKISEIIRKKILNISIDRSLDSEKSITTLESMLEESEKQNNRLYSLVCQYMDEKGYRTDADFYNSISMSRQNFARIRNKSSNIGKETVLWIVCGLGLNYIEAYQVLAAAGYTFKTNDKRDVVISYIMKNSPGYTLDTVNEMLYKFNLKTFFDD